eukprot:260878-Rhodomonas_salina.1
MSVCVCACLCVSVRVCACLVRVCTRAWQRTGRGALRKSGSGVEGATGHHPGGDGQDAAAEDDERGRGLLLRR